MAGTGITSKQIANNTILPEDLANTLDLTNKVILVTNPTENNQAVNKKYVDRITPAKLFFFASF